MRQNCITKGAKDKPFSGPCNVSQSEWDRIFGKKSARAKAGTYVWDSDKKEFVHESELATKPLASEVAPAVHDDRLFKGWDWGAGKHFSGRADRREWMKRNDMRCKG